jgi:hypothetical protein
MALIRRPPFLELQLLMTDRLTRRPEYFQGTNQSSRVVRMNVRRRNCVNLREPFVQRRLTDVLQFLLDFAPQLPIGRRTIKQSAEKAFEIQRRTANKQRLSPTRTNIGNRYRGRIDILRNAKLNARLDNIEQMVWHCISLWARGLRGTDVHSAINRHGIKRDNLRADPPGKRNPDGRLADGGRAGKKPAVVEGGINQ